MDEHAEMLRMLADQETPTALALQLVSLRRDFFPEHNVSIEIMCIALGSFRYSDEWQRIGEVGRWLSSWCRMWREVGRSARYHISESPFALRPLIPRMHGKDRLRELRQEQHVEIEMRTKEWSRLFLGQWSDAD